jgi:hypothetical protein
MSVVSEQTVMVSRALLIEAMAEAMGLPVATVMLYDRQIAAAGLRAKSKRGRGAGGLGPHGAALLLTSILGSGLVKDAASTVERYREARPQRATSTPELYANAGIASLAALPASHNFIDAVTALIEAAATDTLAHSVISSKRQRPLVPLVEVSAMTPATFGEIRIAGTSNGLVTHVVYTLPGPWEKRGRASPTELGIWEAKVRAARASGTFDQYRRVHADHFVRLGHALSEGAKKEGAKR